MMLTFQAIADISDTVAKGDLAASCVPRNNDPQRVGPCALQSVPVRASRRKTGGFARFPPCLPEGFVPGIGVGIL